VRHVNGTSREVDSVEQSCGPEEQLDAGRMYSGGEGRERKEGKGEGEKERKKDDIVQSKKIP